MSELRSLPHDKEADYFFFRRAAGAKVLQTTRGTSGLLQRPLLLTTLSNYTRAP